MLARIKQQELTWEEAIATVLRRADGALHYADIAEAVSTQRLKSSVGANPAATVASVMSRCLADDRTQFLRVGRGEYTLLDKSVSISSLNIDEAGHTVESPETGALKAFGMFWKRNEVVWTGKPRLLGKQQAGATDVNFAEQVGVYLLHDRERVIYVGRAADLMYTRLRAHTIDRMGGRWDRFSWFGLKSVGPDGELMEPSIGWTHEVVIETLEALLIESLEPPLNRKRGDNFSGAEYLQVSDPEIETIRKKQLISELVKQAGLGDT